MKNLRPIAIMLALGLLSGCGNYETEIREIGYLGEARFNAFLAAGKLLEERGYLVERKRSRAPLSDPYRAALFVPADSIQNPADARRYRRWIEDGGHVIYLASGAGMLAWDETSNDWKIDQEAEREHPLLELFDIQIDTTSGSGTAEVKAEAEPGDAIEEQLETITEIRRRNHEQGEVMLYSVPLEVQMHSNQRLDTTEIEDEIDVLLGTFGEAQLVSMPVDRGRLSILTSAYPLRNRYIGDLDHGPLLVELMQTHSAHSVSFLHGGGLTFFGMLIEHGWMPLLGLGLLCVFWIWKNLPRFGPAIPHIDLGERQFTEHIEMTGRFLWRNKAAPALLSPVVSYIRRGLHRRHPHLADDLDGAIEYFVENTGLPAEEIAEALGSAPVEDPASMTRVVKNLKTLTESL